MTFEEFENEYKRLAQEFPKEFGSSQRKALIAERVLMLPRHWFKKFIDRMIITANPRLDIEEAARGERLSRAEHELKSQTDTALKVVKEKMSDEALKGILKNTNASNLWEAVKKAKESK